MVRNKLDNTGYLKNKPNYMFRWNIMIQVNERCINNVICVRVFNSIGP